MKAISAKLVIVILLLLEAPLSAADGTQRNGGAASRPEVYKVWPFEKREASSRQDETAKVLGVPKELSLDLKDKITIRFVLIPAGKFCMGAPANRIGGANEAAAQKDTCVPKPYYIGKYLVTQEQYEVVMGKNPSRFKGSTRPVDSVTWDEAATFCVKVSETTGKKIRLPNEVEWEYACRAGTSEEFEFSNDEAALGDFGWYDPNSGKETHPVGQKKPNAFGLYDMHGNVWEWCSDIFPFPEGNILYTKGDKQLNRTPHVIRGGSCLCDAKVCSSSFRDAIAAANRYCDLGFRIVCEVP